MVELPGVTEMINDGDDLEIDAKGGKLTNKTKGETYNFTPLPDFALDIIAQGGLLNKLAAEQR